MTTFTTRNGISVQIDNCDLQIISGYAWRAIAPTKSKPDRLYVMATVREIGKKKATLWMHRLLLNAPSHLVVDHINHNGLDNRRCNLRLCTKAQNASHAIEKTKSKSGYRGVGVTSHGRFRASIARINKTPAHSRHLGVFNTAYEAAMAYDAAAKFQFGEFATLNFPSMERVA